jgi:hypothetical protein
MTYIEANFCLVKGKGKKSLHKPVQALSAPGV